MTYRTFHGVRFKVFSPSLWELDATDDTIALVAIAFADKAWWINVLMRHGRSHNRGPYRTRDEALAMIADRRMAS